MVRVGLEQRGMAARIILDARPRDRLARDRVAHYSRYAPGRNRLAGSAGRSETDRRTRPPERHEDRAKEDEEGRRESEGVANEQVAPFGVGGRGGELVIFAPPPELAPELDHYS